MAQDTKQPSDAPPQPDGRRRRKPYSRPDLVRYGDVRDLTQGAGNTMNEGSPGTMMS